jgi:tetratricopeptide (TPR) repeat protein/tRNA A-37 threonylcarbamoyl transferase component Bud32
MESASPVSPSRGAVPDRGEDPRSALPVAMIVRMDQICDRFEAAWQAGGQPRIEDYRDDLAGPGRAVLLRDLLVLELAYRRRRGEQPTPAGCRSRFPEHAALIDEVFRVSAADPPQPARSRPAEARTDADGSRPAGPLGSGHRGQARTADPDRQAPRFDIPTTCPPEAAPDASPASSPLSMPTSSGRRFRILRHHVRGGLGEVYVARDEELHREVALKEIQDRHADDPQSRSRFVLEAEITGGLEHPGVVPVYGLGQHPDGRPFYAMRFIHGESFRDSIARFHRAEGPGRDPGEGVLELRQLLGRFLDVCNALAYAHSRGVLHRDLKPDNVMLGPYGETLVVDWGLAKLFDGKASTARSESGPLKPPSMSRLAPTLTGAAMGTPPYMSPEQAAGQLDRLGPASDVYSLGATLYCLLTGRAPFEDRQVDLVLQKVRRGDFPPPRQIKGSVAPPLESICLKAMALEPADRYATPRALAEDIEHWLADEPVSAYQEGWSEHLARWSRRHRTWTQAGAAALLAVTVISVVAAVLVDHARRDEQFARQQERAARTREDQQRRLAGALAENRRRRLVALRTKGQALLLLGQEATARGDWRDAKLQLSNALATFGPEPELVDLRSHAGRLLGETDRRLAAEEARQTARGTYQRFLKLRDDAMSQGTLLTILGLPTDLEATEKTCRQALALYGVAEETEAAPSLDGRHLIDRERAEVTTGCFELLLLLAEALAQPPPRQPPDAPRIRRAIRILDRAAGLGFRNRAYHLRRAHYWAQLGEPRREAEDLQRAEALRPAGAADDFLSGHERVMRGDLDRALLDFEHALRLQPDHFWAQYLSAVCYLKLQRPAEARTGLTAYLSRRPDFVWIYLLRGVASGEIGDFEAAEADFGKALELDADKYARYGIYVNRGIVGIRRGDFAAAIADLQRAIGLMPDQYQAHAVLSRAYQDQGKWAQAIGSLDEAIRLEPTLAPLLRDRARLDQGRQDPDAALRDLAQAIDLEAPDSPLVVGDRCERGQILYLQQRYPDVVRECDAALGIDADDAVALHLRAKALLKLRQYEEAARACDRYLKAAGPMADIFRIRGRSRERLADYAGAVDDYTRAMGLEPSPDLLIHRGWAYGFSDAWRLAEVDFEEAVRRDPRSSAAFAGRGYARLRLGHDREAVEDAEEALRREPVTPITRFQVTCLFSRAIGQVEADAPAAERRAVVTQYRERALEVLRGTLDSLPAAERRAFWAGTMRPDPDLDPIRHSAGFAQLEAEYAAPAK